MIKGRSSRLDKAGRERAISLTITICTFAVIITAWIVATRLKIVSEVLFPGPEKVLKAIVSTQADGYKQFSLLMHLLNSMKRLLLAYVIAVITGVTLGLASGYSSKIRAVFDPIVEFYQSIPPLAYFTLLIIWLGFGDESKIVLLSLAAFAPIFIASMSGVKSVKADYINGALTLGAGKGQVFRFVILPACLPYIFTGLRTAMATAFGTLVAAEMVASVSGIGWMVFDASRFLRTDIVFTGIVVMGITSIILDRTIRFAESRIVPWKGKE